MELSRIFNRERVNALIMAFLLIAVVLIALGVIQFIDASLKLQGNLSQQMQSGEITLDPQSAAEAQGIVAADIARRKLDRQRNTALVLAGAGLALGAVGWLGYDIARGRRSKARRQSPAE